MAASIAAWSAAMVACMVATLVPAVSRSCLVVKFLAASGVRRGAYVLADAGNGKPDVILMATGSEVGLCLEVYEKLKAEGVAARVVSMPSWELFEQQGKEYRDTVLPPRITARVAVEAGATIGWDRYAGSSGMILGMHRFGASAPPKPASLLPLQNQGRASATRCLAR